MDAFTLLWNSMILMYDPVDMILSVIALFFVGWLIIYLLYKFYLSGYISPISYKLAVYLLLLRVQSIICILEFVPLHIWYIIVIIGSVFIFFYYFDSSSQNLDLTTASSSGAGVDPSRNNNRINVNTNLVQVL